MGRTKVSIALSDEDLRKLDTLRGSVPRSDFVAHLIKRDKLPSEIKDGRLISAFSECTTAIKAYIASEDEGEDEDDAIKKLDIYTKISDMTDMMKSYMGR